MHAWSSGSLTTEAGTPVGAVTSPPLQAALSLQPGQVLQATAPNPQPTPVRSNAPLPQLTSQPLQPSPTGQHLHALAQPLQPSPTGQHLQATYFRQFVAPECGFC